MSWKQALKEMLALPPKGPGAAYIAAGRLKQVAEGFRDVSEAQGMDAAQDEYSAGLL